MSFYSLTINDPPQRDDGGSKKQQLADLLSEAAGIAMSMRLDMEVTAIWPHVWAAHCIAQRMLPSHPKPEQQP